jgi:ankyrin repeat protein
MGLTGRTLLHEVAATGNVEAIRWVSSRSRGMTNVCDKLGRTPLLTALIAGAGAEAVQELLKNGEDPAEEDEVGRNTAEAAVLYCSTDVVQIILDATKKVQDNEVDVKKTYVDS